MTVAQLEKRTSLMALALFVSWILSGTSEKCIPGGPFVSIVGELLPVVISFLVLTTGFLSLQNAPGIGKFIVAVLMCIGAALIADVSRQVLSFWFNPYARGTLISW
jgi:hypothetical protein